jgi:hypothetical protein
MLEVVRAILFGTKKAYEHHYLFSVRNGVVKRSAF